MRILLDNCVPWRFGGMLEGHVVSAVVKIGWADLDDGPLLDAIEGKFDVLVTMDKSLPFQQRIDHRSFGIVVLRARGNSLPYIEPLVPTLLQTLTEARPGEVKEVGPVA